jgi:drug/metabolite transporter (DMT)-like permease
MNEAPKTSLILVYVKLILTALFWGGTFIAGRVLAKEVGPGSAAFLRFLIAAVLLIILTRWIEGRLPRVKIRHIGAIIILGMTGIFAYNICFFKGLKMIEAGRAAIIIATCPVIIGVLSVCFFKEKITVLKGAGIILSVSGAIIVTTRGEPWGIFQGNIGWGEVLIFGCVLSWTAYSLIGKKAMGGELSPLAVVAYSAVVGTVALAIPAWQEGMVHNISSYSGNAWLSIIYLGVLGTVVGFVWYYEAIKKIGPMKAGLFINFVPIFAIILAFIMLGESITPSLLTGGALVCGGVYLTNRKTITARKN